MKYQLKNRLIPWESAGSGDPASVTIEILTPEELVSTDSPISHRPLFLAAIRQIHSCSAELYGSCVFGSISIPSFQNILGSKISLGYHLQKNSLILVDDGDTARSIFEKLTDFDYSGGSSPAFFFITFLNMLVREDMLGLQSIENHLTKLEEQVTDTIPPRFSHTILHYRKTLMTLHTYYEQLTGMAETLETNVNSLFTPEETAAFDLCSRRFDRLHNHVEMLREYLLQIREMYQSQLDLSQNRTMNMLTVVTTLFLPLTLLAGWYGMNFSNMPELQSPYGYTAVALISILILGLEIYYFKKKQLL